MNEQFAIQCQSCGTLFNESHGVCPYCGEPQPPSNEETDLAYFHRENELSFEEEPVSTEDLFADDDIFAVAGSADETAGFFESRYEDDEALSSEEELFAADDLYTDGDYPDEISGFTTPTGYQGRYPALTESSFTEDDLFNTAPADQFETYDRVYGDGYVEQEYGDERYQPGQDYSFSEQAGPLYQLAEAEEAAPVAAAHFFVWRRMWLGCAGVLVCMALFYGGIGLVAIRQGLTERASLTKAEAEAHYQKAQEHLNSNSIDLAIAEFQMAISLNPNFLEARQALREAQRIAQTQPTPTSETRAAAAVDLFAQAKTQIDQQQWTEAAETLSQVRDLDPSYEATQVSELLYQANYESGLQFVIPNKLEEALAAFERALAERPEDSEASVQQMKATLYLAGVAAVEENNHQEAVEHFSQLYQTDAEYLDVKQLLRRAHERVGDELAEASSWCLAEAQYNEASILRPSEALETKISESSARCQQDELVAQQATPVTRVTAPAARPAKATAPTATPAPDTSDAATPPPAADQAQPANTTQGGSILFSAWNPYEARWEIVAVPANGGSPTVLVLNGTMPALSPNRQLLLYHAELRDSEGFHVLDLTSGEDRRITLRPHHILPRWGGNNAAFIFVAEEPGTGRWQIQQGFADGKSDPIILHDGRTPDWSPDGSTIAYQGTNPQGNEPGLYLVPFGGGEPRRLTDHESDRTPIFSPNGSQLAYMSTRNGNWDIYTISTAGSSPRQITTNSSSDGLPTWSPDGSRIAYVSDAGGSWAIYTIPAGGGTPTKVTAWDGTRHPDWLVAQIWWTK